MSDLPRSVRVGIFDSGVGGLTVMRAITQTWPHLAITYFGDTARLPYGEKSSETILRFSQENIAFLQTQGVDLIVIACNTVSSLALPQLHAQTHLPLLGVIEPGVEQALAKTRTGRIAILGTRGTIASGVYQNALRRHLPNAHLVPIACPLLVPLVEEHMINHQATRMIALEYLSQAISEKVDTVILGCTHYPLLAPMIQEQMGQDVALIDSGAACAEKIQSYLYPNNFSGCLGIQPQLFPQDSLPAHRFFVSDNPEKFRRMGEQILGTSIDAVGLFPRNAITD